MKRAFVAGATGYTGREVVRELRARGVEVHAHVRPDSPALASWKARFEPLGAIVDTTPWEPEAMKATLTRLAPDAVFALLGTTRARQQRTRAAGGDAERDSYEAVDYGLTVLLLNAAVASGAAPRFVYLSSLGVTDDTRNAYLQARARVERELRGVPLPVVVARPSLITGDDRDEKRTGERVASVALGVGLGVLGALGASKLRAKYAAMDGATLARALVEAAEQAVSGHRVLEADALRRVAGG